MGFGDSYERGEFWEETTDQNMRKSTKERERTGQYCKFE